MLLTIHNVVAKKRKVKTFRGYKKDKIVNGKRGSRGEVRGGVLGASPYRGRGAEHLIKGSKGDQSPLKLKAFRSLDTLMSGKIRNLLRIIVIFTVGVTEKIPKSTGLETILDPEFNENGEVQV